MTRYRIVCKVLSEDGNYIQKIGLTSDTSNNRATSTATPKQINQKISNGDQCFFTNENKKEVEVIECGDSFIKTKADRTLINNLRHLRDCKF